MPKQSCNIFCGVLPGLTEVCTNQRPKMSRKVVTTWGTQRKTFKKHLTMSFKFTRTEGACYHRITAFPGKLRGVLHSQEDGTNIFPIQLHNMSELCAFHHEHPYIQQIFKEMYFILPASHQTGSIFLAEYQL